MQGGKKGKETTRRKAEEAYSLSLSVSVSVTQIGGKEANKHNVIAVKQ